MEFPLTDAINIVLSILSFVLAVISITFVVLTLKQNSRMIEASTRPYIVAYMTASVCNGRVYHLVVKNFGQTSAHIDTFHADHDLGSLSYLKHLKPFSNLPNTTIAPGQSYICSLNPDQIREQNASALKIEISYSAGGKRYSDSYSIDIGVLSNLVILRYATDGEDLRSISQALQEIADRML